MASAIPVLAAEISSNKWNANECFRYADAATFSRCVRTKNPLANNEYGNTSLHLAASVNENLAIIEALAKDATEFAKPPCTLR